MTLRITLLFVLLLTASCAPVLQTQIPEETTSTSTRPPDTVVTNPPVSTEPVEPTGNQFAPQPEDKNLSRGTAFVHEASLLIRESYPPQISLHIKGDLPTPCHLLRVEIKEPTPENQVNIDVYSLVDPDLICTQILAPFDESIDLGTFPGGHYSVSVNGEPAGEFDS
jgi:hypothetical protein